LEGDKPILRSGVVNQIWHHFLSAEADRQPQEYRLFIPQEIVEDFGRRYGRNNIHPW